MIIETNQSKKGTQKIQPFYLGFSKGAKRQNTFVAARHTIPDFMENMSFVSADITPLASKISMPFLLDSFLSDRTRAQKEPRRCTI